MSKYCVVDECLASPVLGSRFCAEHQPGTQSRLERLVHSILRSDLKFREKDGDLPVAIVLTARQLELEMLKVESIPKS